MKYEDVEKVSRAIDSIMLSGPMDDYLYTVWVREADGGRHRELFRGHLVEATDEYRRHRGLAAMRAHLETLREPTAGMVLAWAGSATSDEGRTWASRTEPPDGWSDMDIGEWRDDAPRCYADWTAMIDAAMKEIDDA